MVLEKPKRAGLFLFFGQIGTTFIQRASQLFILAVVRCAFLIELQTLQIGTSLNTFLGIAYNGLRYAVVIFNGIKEQNL